ncbi:TonB-dependent receptor [Dysgonomonas sp. HGC4]|uniref:TonB-dependent receptor n=1 Tax=Dysgonomonas sp. HGC4 TaxID=1658009 RepID=UPI0006807BB1|nr:TonB-dependent receptor [Dysgonomonas sp. HGC4]MBD8346433.1 TonB-dependent receptor [Dysgonomonas sp. HGC4]
MKKYSILMLLLIYICNTSNLSAEEILIPKDSIVMSYTGEEVVIEAFKSNTNLSQLPISATLLSDQIIKERNITNIKEINAFVPNLFIPDYGSKMTSPAYIRGIGSRINAPSVGLYVDGVPYFDRSTFDIDMTDIERVEVLRGPQGTIYGRNTMGGIINVYTKSPYKYKETNIHLGAGNYNSYDLGASHYGNINNTFGYSLSGNVFHTGGFFTNKYTGDKADPMDAANGRMRLSWKLAPKLSMHLVSAYEYSDQGGYPYGIYNAENNTVGQVNYNEPSSYLRNMSTNGLNVEYATEKFKLGSMSSFQFYDGKQRIDQDFTEKDLYFVDFYQRQRMYSQEINIKSTTKSNYQWQFGTFGFHQSYNTDNDVDNRSTNTHTLQNASNPTKGAALYHQSIINNLFTEGLSLTLGLRYDWEETRMHTVAKSRKPDNTVVETTNKRDKDNYSQWTPKAALQYSFRNNQIVYFSASKGFKTGGFNTTAVSETDRTYKSETSWNYEIGTKGSYFDKLLDAEISLFYIDWRDQQVSQNQATGTGYILRNAGKSASKGLEVTTQINPLENLNFQITYGYTHASFKEYIYNTKENIDYSGNFLPMVPRHTFSTAANYTIRLKSDLLDKVILNGQYTALGKIYWNEDNKASQPFYGIFNARASFVKNKVSFDFWSKNIGGKEYVSYYFYNSLAKESFAQAGKPFTCGVDFRLKF